MSTTLTKQEVEAILTQQKDDAAVNTVALFAPVKGMTIANVQYVTDVTLKAASPLRHKVVKVTSASVMLANNLREYTNVYINKVLRTADEAIEKSEWVPSETYFTHTPTHCVAVHKSREQYYLYSLYNSARTAYVNTVTGELMTKEEVAAEMSPSAAKKLLEDNSTVYNKTNDVTHTAIVRTVKLENIASITMNGQTTTGAFTYSK